MTTYEKFEKEMTILKHYGMQEDFKVILTRRGVSAPFLVEKKYNWPCNVIINDKHVSNGDLTVLKIKKSMVTTITIPDSNMFSFQIWLYRDLHYSRYSIYTVDEIDELPPAELLKMKDHFENPGYVRKFYNWWYDVGPKVQTGISSSCMQIEILKNE